MAQAGVRIKFNHIPEVLRTVPQKADAAVEALAFEGERHIKQAMESSPADGRTYTVGSGQTHTASSPGNAPRIDTGTLINAIQVTIAGMAKRKITAGTDYAMALEFGTSKMAARPFMVPMIVYLEQNSEGFFMKLIEV